MIKKTNKKYTVRDKASNILGVIAGLFWIYIGIKRTFVDNWGNILIVLIGVIMIF